LAACKMCTQWPAQAALCFLLRLSQDSPCGSSLLSLTIGLHTPHPYHRWHPPHYHPRHWEHIWGCCQRVHCDHWRCDCWRRHVRGRCNHLWFDKTHVHNHCTCSAKGRRPPAGTGLQVGLPPFHIDLGSAATLQLCSSCGCPLPKVALLSLPLCLLPLCRGACLPAPLASHKGVPIKQSAHVSRPPRHDCACRENVGYLECGDTSNLLATACNFEYVDVWSARTTWGGNDPPTEGQSVFIPSGATVRCGCCAKAKVVALQCVRQGLVAG